MASPRGVLLKTSPNGPRRSLKKCPVEAVPHSPECGPFEESGAAIALSELIDDAMAITNMARQRVEAILTSPGLLPSWVRRRETAAGPRQPGCAETIGRKRPRRAA
jgi:hypothetical protein